jgi:hypothetical protein
LDEEPDDMHRKVSKKKQKQSDKIVRLTAEHKYEIANKELEQLKQNIEEGREKSETMLERLKGILEGTDMTIAEIRKEAFDFGRFLSSAENGRTGKYDAEKLIKYMDDKFKAKEALIDKINLKNISYKNAIMKADAQIKQKEEMGDDLKFIDFHQLQIENKKHVKDIDERNKKLLALKLNSNSTMLTLENLKEKLKEANREAEEIQLDMKIKRQKLEKTRKAIRQTQRKIARLNFNKKQMEALKTQITEMPNPIKFVEQKNETQELINCVKNKERKIEIAEVAAKRARAIIRKNGGYVDNGDHEGMDLPDIEYN